MLNCFFGIVDENDPDTKLLVCLDDLSERGAVLSIQDSAYKAKGKFIRSKINIPLVALKELHHHLGRQIEYLESEQ